MKNYFWVSLAFCLFVTCLCDKAFAEEEGCQPEGFLKSERIIEGKYYVEPGTIYISPAAIFLHLGDNCLAIDRLFSDNSGVFVYVEDILKAKDTWECRFCGMINTGGKFCVRCHKPRKEACISD